MAFVERFKAEQEAVQSLSELLSQAQKCLQLYERANMAPPEPLKRVLGMNGIGPDDGEPELTSHIPPPNRLRPREAEQDWIWIDAKQAMPTSLALAALRTSRVPLQRQDVTNSVREILPHVNEGTIANIGTKLAKDGIIKRDDQGWHLIKPESAGILQDGILWGPRGIFIHYEVAAYRREAILYLLGFFSAGLQTSQIIEQLRKCLWLQAPVNKELVQDDVEMLQKNEKIRRRGASKKWELVPVEKTGEK